MFPIFKIKYVKLHLAVPCVPYLVFTVVPLDCWPQLGWNIQLHDLSTGDLSTGDLSTGDLSTGDLSTGDLSTGDLSTGDLSTGVATKACR